MEPVPAPEATISEEDGVITVVIPSRPHPATSSAFGCMLAVAALALAGLIGPIMRPGEPSLAAAVSFASLALVAGLAIAWQWAYATGGREIVTVSKTTLRIRREAFGPSRTWEFPLAAISRLRYYPPPPEAWVGAGRGEPTGGALAFTHDSQPFRFGSGLTEPEARRLLGVLRDRFGLEVVEPSDIDEVAPDEEALADGWVEPEEDVPEPEVTPDRPHRHRDHSDWSPRRRRRWPKRSPR